MLIFSLGRSRAGDLHASRKLASSCEECIQAEGALLTGNRYIDNRLVNAFC